MKTPKKMELTFRAMKRVSEMLEGLGRGLQSPFLLPGSDAETVGKLCYANYRRVLRRLVRRVRKLYPNVANRIENRKGGEA